MNEIETVGFYMERHITKLDVVKTEHDLISDYIARANRCIEDGVAINTESMVRYIDGIRTMAEALLDILEEETALEKLLNHEIGMPTE